MGKNRPAIPKCRTREGSKEEGTGDEEIRLLELFNVDREAGLPNWYFLSVSITSPLVVSSCPLWHILLFLFACFFLASWFFYIKF